MTQILQSFRSLLKKPVFFLTTVLILALGIGGVTAMFSILYETMYRPLAYPEPERLVLGRATYQSSPNPWGSGADFLDYREQSRSFSSLEAFFCAPNEVTLRLGDESLRILSLQTTAGFFDALGVKMHLGRGFLKTEAEPGAAPVVVVSHAFWRKHFPGESELGSRSLLIDGRSCQIVGVAPADFHFSGDADLWSLTKWSNLGPRRFNNWLLLGRLKNGVSLGEAQGEVDLVASRLEKTYPETNTDKALLLTPIQGALSEKYKASFGLLLGGAAAILLIACTNAAGLLLARGSERRGELAVRSALGASRAQIARLLLGEALLLAVFAGLLGSLLAYWLQKTLLLLMPVESTLLREQSFSPSVLAAALFVSLLAGLGAGLLPALRGRKPDLVRDLKAGGRGATSKGFGLRGGLVATQIAASFALLVLAGMMAKSLSSLQDTNTGFDTRRLLTFELPLPARSYGAEKRSAFFEAFLAKARALPGVQAAGAISQLPLRSPFNNIEIYAAGRPPASPAELRSGNQRSVFPGYFKALGISLLEGRDIEDGDGKNSAKAIVLSKSLAETLFPGENPLGRQAVIDGDEKNPCVVVGVVADIKGDNLRETIGVRGTFYRPHAQVPTSTMGFAVRTALEPRALAADLRRIVREMDPAVPFAGPRTMEAIVENAVSSEKAQALCLGGFSALALTLAAVGLYGLLSYCVNQERRDIGIRIALGAPRGKVLAGVLRRAGLLALAGILAGCLLAALFSALLRSFLYGVDPGEPLPYALAALALGAVALSASWLPARRAAGTDPIDALRSD